MTTRTVYVTGGYADTLEVDVAAAVDLAAASFRVALVDDDLADVPPAADDAAWQNGTTGDGGFAGVVKRAVTSSTAPGRYGVWLRVTIAGVTFPVRVLGDDGRPWVVRVV